MTPEQSNQPLQPSPAASPTPTTPTVPPAETPEAPHSPDIIGIAATETPITMPKSAFAQTKAQKSTPKLAIILVIILAVIAIGAAIVYFLIFDTKI